MWCMRGWRMDGWMDGHGEGSDSIKYYMKRSAAGVGVKGSQRRMARCSQIALVEVDLLTHDDILSGSIFFGCGGLKGYLGVTENITPSAMRSSSASGGVSLGAAFQNRYYEVWGGGG